LPYCFVAVFEPVGVNCSFELSACGYAFGQQWMFAPVDGGFADINCCFSSAGSMRRYVPFLGPRCALGAA